MYKNLIHSLSYMHSLIVRGKGVVSDAALMEIAQGAHVMTQTAPVIEQSNGAQESANDKAYLQEARKLDEQIEEMTVFLLSLEIV
jgi:hypothetical protein